MGASDQETIRLAEKPKVPLEVRYRLVVIGDGVFSMHALPQSGEVTIGRAEDADIRIDDQAVSRKHGVIRVGARVELEDLGSANGTRVRERRLEPKQRIELLPGDVIEVGSTMIVLQRDTPTGRGEWHIATHEKFVERLARECARGSTFSLLRFQITGGVPAASIQEALAQLLKPTDLLASYGPGEFELLLSGIGPDDAEQLASRSAHRLEALGGRVRTGVACSPRDGAAVEPLLAACTAVRPMAVPFVVSDDAMQKLHRMIDRIAPSGINVLLLGETGVGKEVLAGEVHRRSSRASRPFLALNCAALSENLLESELFGYEKGAFTGAVKSKPGLLETAAGGTVFLDEVGEMPPSIQAKLLRVLEERQVMPVGGLKPVPIDVRFVFATHRDLEAEVARGAFREDLYYRINGIALLIPPLRERIGEIEPLAREFIAQTAKKEGRRAPELSADALETLRRYSWPGNIRELRNAIERAVLLAGDGPILSEHLALGRPKAAVARAREVAPSVPDLKEERRAAERRAILEALERCGGNQTKAAKLLNISRRTLVSRLQEYGLTTPRKKPATSGEG